MATTSLATLGTEMPMTTEPGLRRAVVTVPWMTRIEEHPQWSVLSQLPLTMCVCVSLKNFKVRDLLALKTGQVFETVSPDTDDVPVKVGHMQVGWSEFEVVEQRIAIRLTRLVDRLA